MKICAVIVLLFVCFCSAQENPDKITNLPLLNFDLTQYSGYIEVDSSHGRKLHYWFIESQGNPERDPLVLWMNGGPGCSSLDGLFYEHGPIHFREEANLELVKNPYAWTTVANVIYLEAPAGVGFSFSNDANDYITNDNKTADDNYTFLKMWYKKYPKFLQNEIWIAGESYAGVYVPTLAKRVLDGILDKSFVVPFKGVLVGNGVTNSPKVTFLNAYVEFLWGHSIISNKIYKHIHAICDPNPNSKECQEAEQILNTQMNGINVYNIYGDCFSQRPLFDNGKFRNVGGNIPCVSANYANDYLNRQDVKQAIHVNESISWGVCSDYIGNHYNQTQDSMVPIYKYLLSNKKTVFIYSGDVDFSVPYTNTQLWTSEDMGLTAINDWRQWFITDIDGPQVAGFVTEYQGGFTYATIRGAGHMVPQYKPEAGLAFFERVLKGQPL